MAIANFGINGDFDVQVDFEYSNLGAGSFEVSLELRVDINNRLKVLYEPHSNRWNSKRFIGGVAESQFFTEAIGPSNPRKLRIVRSGSNWTSYRYTSTGSWVALHSNQAIGSGDITFISIYNNSFDAPGTLDAFFDNWTINSADEVVCAGSSSSSSSMSSSSSTSSSSSSSSKSSSFSSSSFSSCAIALDDDFTGINGQNVNPNRWSPNELIIQNNKARGICNAGETFNQCETAYKLIGDFDVQVDWECVSGCNTGTAGWSGNLWVRVVGDNNNRAIIYYENYLSICFPVVL